MSQTFTHVQPSLNGGLHCLTKPYTWSKLESGSNLVTNTIYGRGERTENTTNAVKWNQSGSRLLGGGRDSTIRLYDTEGSSVRSIQEYRQHTGSITSLAFDSPESEHMFASTSKDNTFRIWDARKPKTPIHVERTKEEIIRGIFSPG